MNTTDNIILALAGLLLVSGKMVYADTSNPAWIDNPPTVSGVSAVGCVKHKGDVGHSRSKAQMKARVNLAKQIESKVSALQKLSVSDVGESFESHATTSVNQLLNGSRLVSIAKAHFDKQAYYCALVASSPKQTKQVFDLLMQSTKGKIDIEQQQQIFKRFIEYKATHPF